MSSDPAEPWHYRRGDADERDSRREDVLHPDHVQLDVRDVKKNRLSALLTAR